MPFWPQIQAWLAAHPKIRGIGVAMWNGLCAFARFLLFPSFCAVMGGFAFSLANYVAQAQHWTSESDSFDRILRPTAVVFGGALILEALKRFEDVIVLWGDFTNNFSVGTLAKAAAVVISVVGGFSLAYYAVADEDPNPSIAMIFNPNLPQVDAPPPDPPAVKFLVTFKDEASCKSWASEDQGAPENGAKGFAVAPGDADLIKSIACDIAACSPAGTPPVQLEVVGFASSSTPQEDPDREICKNRKIDPDRELNLRIANRRAQRVLEILNQLRRRPEDCTKLSEQYKEHPEKLADFADRIIAIAHPWRDDQLAEMERRRSFNDTSPGGYSKLMARLNRRVEINVTSAGLAGCAPRLVPAAMARTARSE